MSLIDVPDFGVASSIVRALNLEEQSLYYDTCLENRQCNTEPLRYVPLHSKMRTFTTTISGAHLIQQDDEGRLCLALVANPSAWKWAIRVPEGLHLSSDNLKGVDTALAEHGLVPIFTGNGISALAYLAT